MIVRQFLQWVRQAPPGERAEATSALARAYLYSDLSADDLAAAEGAMIMLLDDASPLVRRAMAEAFASAEGAPQIVVHALAADQPDVALPILAHSPLLVEDDLVDLIATGEPAVRDTWTCRRYRRGRYGRGMSHTFGKSRARRGALLVGSNYRAFRSPGAHPRKSYGAR